MEPEIVSWAAAWVREPIGISVGGTVLAFLAVSVIKGLARWIWSTLTNIPRRLERWVNRRQSML